MDSQQILQSLVPKKSKDTNNFSWVYTIIGIVLLVGGGILLLSSLSTPAQSPTPPRPKPEKPGDDINQVPDPVYSECPVYQTAAKAAACPFCCGGGQGKHGYLGRTSNTPKDGCKGGNCQKVDIQSVMNDTRNRGYYIKDSWEHDKPGSLGDSNAFCNQGQQAFASDGSNFFACCPSVDESGKNRDGGSAKGHFWLWYALGGVSDINSYCCPQIHKSSTRPACNKDTAGHLYVDTWSDHPQVCHWDGMSGGTWTKISTGNSSLLNVGGTTVWEPNNNACAGGSGPP